MTHHLDLDLDTVTLKSGSHGSRDAGVCLMEAVAWWAGEAHSDRPACTCPVLAAFARAWNDGMRSDAERAQLLRYVPLLVGTRGTSEDEDRRAWSATDWLVRVHAPAWLDLAGLSDHATTLRGMGPLTGLDTVDPAPIDAAQDAARDAARATAWAAVGAAAGAARAAARDTAGAAAWATAGAAAWATAGAAAWAAAGAARAARDVLEPTVQTLQASAHDLFQTMIESGPHSTPQEVAS